MIFLREVRPQGVLNKTELYKLYLNIINCFAPVKLTETEIDILVYIYSCGKVLTSEIRRKLREFLSISDKNLNNFISKLKKKSAIKDNEINSRILPPNLESEDEINNFVVQITLKVQNVQKEHNEIVGTEDKV